MFLFIQAAASASYVFAYIEISSNYTTYFPVDPYSMDYTLGLLSSIFYFCALITIMFLAFVRCLCVATPLWFRQKLGTKKITIVFLTPVTTFILVIEIPIFVSMGLIQLYDKTFTQSEQYFGHTWQIRGK